MGATNYTFDERQQLNKKIHNYLKPYYENDGKLLRKVVDEILVRLKYHDVQKDEFLSLADEVIANAIYDYDFKQDFKGYIYRCLENKFKTYMTRLNRIKRTADRIAVSLEEKCGNDCNSATYAEFIADKNTIESEFFSEKEEAYSKSMTDYLCKLSELQKEVLRLISIGFTSCEIIEELHITQKQYNDCYSAIHSYKNIKILM